MNVPLAALKTVGVAEQGGTDCVVKLASQPKFVMEEFVTNVISKSPPVDKMFGSGGLVPERVARTGSAVVVPS